MDKRPPEPAYPVLFTMLWQQLVPVARECGYALGLHGSMVRDLDVMAMPWTDQATDVETLINTLCSRCRLRRDAVTDLSQDKPHGRLSFLLLWDGHCVLDLSVMPPNKLSIKERRAIYKEPMDSAMADVWALTKKNYPELLVYKGWFFWWMAPDKWFASQNIKDFKNDKIGPFKSRKLLKAELDRRAN